MRQLRWSVADVVECLIVVAEVRRGRRLVGVGDIRIGAGLHERRRRAGRVYSRLGYVSVVALSFPQQSGSMVLHWKHMPVAC